MKKYLMASMSLFIAASADAGSPELDQLASKICAEPRLYEVVAYAYLPPLLGLDPGQSDYEKMKRDLKFLISNLHNVRVKDGAYYVIGNRMSSVRCEGTMTLDTTWYHNRKGTGNTGGVAALDVNFSVNFPNGASLKEYLSPTVQIENVVEIDNESIEAIKASKKLLNVVAGKSLPPDNSDQRKYNNGKTNDEVMLARYNAGQFSKAEWAELNDGEFRSPRPPEPEDNARLIKALVDTQQQFADEVLKQSGIKKGSPEYVRILEQAEADAAYEAKFRRTMKACGTDQSCKVAVVQAMTK